MKTKEKFKLYVPVTRKLRYANTEKYEYHTTMLGAEKVEGVNLHLPPKELILEHLGIERLKLEKDPNYKPIPLIIRLEKAIFAKAQRDIKIKTGMELQYIPLTISSQNVPVCVMAEKEEEKQNEN